MLPIRTFRTGKCWRNGVSLLDTLYFLKTKASFKKFFCFKTSLVKKKELRQKHVNTSAKCYYKSNTDSGNCRVFWKGNASDL